MEACHALFGANREHLHAGREEPLLALCDERAAAHGVTSGKEYCTIRIRGRADWRDLEGFGVS
jgi:hypothetical protein